MTDTITWDRRAWNEIVSHVIETEGVERMRRVADACNRDGKTDQYMLSTEGDKKLRLRSYRVTVITTGADAMRDNVLNDRLLSNLYLAGGAA